VARLYRITHNNPPTERDFMSHAALGKPKPASVPQRSWEGVSVSIDKDEALAHARRNPRLGKFIAEMEIPDEVQFEQTGRWWHHEIYEQGPADLVAYVVNTEVVGEA
jgi:hypothetical protein